MTVFSSNEFYSSHFSVIDWEEHNIWPRLEVASIYKVTMLHFCVCLQEPCSGFVVKTLLDDVKCRLHRHNIIGFRENPRCQNYAVRIKYQPNILVYIGKRLWTGRDCHNVFFFFFLCENRSWKTWYQRSSCNTGQSWSNMNHNPVCCLFLA